MDTSDDSFTYTVDDNLGATSNVATVTIAVNDPPVANDDSATVAEGGTVSVLDSAASNVLANDTDVDSPALTATLLSGPANGILTLNPNGTFSYSHDGSETTNDSFDYTLSDGFLTDTATVSIAVTQVNDPPPVPNPRDMKENVVDNLTPFSGESRRIEKAIREVQKSLEPRLWEDDLHLDTKHGNKVFDRERAAVRELMRVLRDNYDDDDRHRKNEVSAEALAAIEAAIDDLVAADRILAQTALDDANAAEVQDPKRERQVERELARALMDLNRGDSEQADDDHDDAIKKYKSSWRHSLKAIKEAAREPRGRRDRNRGRDREDEDDD